mmetsp:Transcript_91671/g.200970  ORF Transcript_91671/g.200970 Transcript_91671/m.200970 type:complete len:587 (-) Transcript_91671:372-2132(-)|eukprot:CAMPEP_0206547300 /NCGR_PEP_ID=MMETSP0325_2-20121206/13214_1 /ASSEMBLY_ACC=CAM_ASM_000347 /TAXON_ID=2866 /ORGANISM="Crypthecodinium cohnii, Strain Seligo" /LENGTH=586 /DNA_ID=CAMNT_0054046579 /DNA_START=165 /DNA_END=1925 /DNA_ORIENTATION=+
MKPRNPCHTPTFLQATLWRWLLLSAFPLEEALGSNSPGGGSGSGSGSGSVVEFPDGAILDGLPPQILELAKLGGKEAVLDAFGPAEGVFLQCWGYYPQSKRRWRDCCTERPGLDSPKLRAWCWPKANQDSWVHELWNYEVCCKHGGQDETADSALYNQAAYEGFGPFEYCPNMHKVTCRLAVERTSLARKTRRLVQGIHAATVASPFPSALERRLRAAVPVLGFAVSHDPDGYYSLRLLRSIDFPVERIVVVLNVVETTPPAWVHVAKELHPEALRIVTPGSNLGCAGGWNSVIEETPWAAYWFIINNDLAFIPGVLEIIANCVADDFVAGNRSTTEDGETDNIYMRSFGLIGGKANLPAFTLTRQAVAEVGLFDENFWPVYGEDEDYFNRMKIIGGGRHFRDESILLIHGPEDWNSEEQGHYSGSENFIQSQGDGSESADRTSAWLLSRQLTSADNGKFFRLKYGPIDQPAPPEFEYYLAGAAPYGLLVESLASNQHFEHSRKTQTRLQNRNSNRSSGSSSSSNKEESQDKVKKHKEQETKQWRRVKHAWTDWVLDPFRRICATGYGLYCGFDRRVLQVPLPTPS